jgi:hypothetical protein
MRAGWPAKGGCRDNQEKVGLPSSKVVRDIGQHEGEGDVLRHHP